MQTLTSPLQFDLLPHVETVKVALMTELLMPFESTKDAEIFWKETDTKLFTLLPEEMTLDSNSLAVISEQFECVESIVHLTENWYLALVITSQDGGGSYLLFQQSIHPHLDQLLTECNTKGENYEPQN
jgi:hypothetical protein